MKKAKKTTTVDEITRERRRHILFQSVKISDRGLRMWIQWELTCHKCRKKAKYEHRRVDKCRTMAARDGWLARVSIGVICHKCQDKVLAL